MIAFTLPILFQRNPNNNNNNEILINHEPLVYTRARRAVQKKKKKKEKRKRKKKRNAEEDIIPYTMTAYTLLTLFQRNPNAEARAVSTSRTSGTARVPAVRWTAWRGRGAPGQCVRPRAARAPSHARASCRGRSAGEWSVRTTRSRRARSVSSTTTSTAR